VTGTRAVEIATRPGTRGFASLQRAASSRRTLNYERTGSNELLLRMRGCRRARITAMAARRPLKVATADERKPAASRVTASPWSWVEVSLTTG
jgi:hypothetical protein